MDYTLNLLPVNAKRARSKQAEVAQLVERQLPKL